MAFSALHALSYIAGTAAFLFVLLSLASGLLYVAEVIEEHSALAKTVGQRTIYGIIVLLVVFHVVDGLPLYLTVLGIFCHLVYLQNFSRTWPSISLTSPFFIASCILVIVSHFTSFNYFSERSRQAANYTSYGSYNHRGNGGGRWNAHSSHQRADDSFLDVATYFGVCVWLCPFFLFLSLSANDNVLPSLGSDTPAPSAPPSPVIGRTPPPHSPSHARRNSSMMKNALSSAFSLVPTNLRPSTLSLNIPTTSRAGGGGAGQREGLIGTPTRSRPSSPNPQGSSFAESRGYTSGAASAKASPSWLPPPSPSVAGSPNVASYASSPGLGGGLRQPPMPTRRHTTEEGPGRGTTGLDTGDGPTGLGLREGPLKQRRMV